MSQSKRSQAFQRRFRWTRLAIALALVLVCLAPGCRRAEGLDQRLNASIKPYRFSILGWEVGQVFSWFRPQVQSPQAQSGSARGSNLGESQQVLAYMAVLSQIQAGEQRINAISAGGQPGERVAQEKALQELRDERLALRTPVTRILGRQIRAVLSAEGIFNPLDRYVRWGVAFPPLSFRLERPPNLLIISPRERIESMREVMLIQDLPVAVVESIEDEVDALGVSSLVTELGGFGATFPTFVSDDASLRYIIRTATEEWLHQYLAFTPLGFRYVLDEIGLARNYAVATMNETLAGMVSDEIAGRVMQAYYPQPAAPPQAAAVPPAPAFDFNRTMREIRLAVDDMLAQGQIERAEQYMEERRQYVVSQGYNIRKLNQAYFAFYGTYADLPSSVDPIGAEMRQLRAGSGSLREFLNRAVRMTRREDLSRAVVAP